MHYAHTKHAYTHPTGTGVGATTFLELFKSRWCVVSAGRQGALLAYRGLRVSMGMHSGLASASEMTFNRPSSRMTYGGT